MALGGFPIPPWLQSRPAEHAEAAQAGLREGLAAAQIWAQANAESARLAEAAKRSDLNAALEREAIQAKSIYEAQKNATDQAYNKQAIALAQQKAQQTQATAAEKAQQWAMTHALAIQRQSALEQNRTTQDALAQARASETARHNAAMEANSKSKAVDPLEQQMADLANKPKVESPGLLSRVGTGIKDLLSGSRPTKPTTTAQDKAARANQIAAQNPRWTREQVVKAVNEEFSGKSSSPSDDDEE